MEITPKKIRPLSIGDLVRDRQFTIAQKSSVTKVNGSQGEVFLNVGSIIKIGDCTEYRFTFKIDNKWEVECEMSEVNFLIIEEDEE